MTPGPGIEPGPHWWKASALSTVPSLFPLMPNFCIRKNTNQAKTEPKESPTAQDVTLKSPFHLHKKKRYLYICTQKTKTKKVQDSLCFHLSLFNAHLKGTKNEISSVNETDTTVWYKIEISEVRMLFINPKKLLPKSSAQKNVHQKIYNPIKVPNC